MLRKLLILGICAGSSASLPILYQSNPDAFHRLVRRAADGAGSAAPAAPAPVAPPIRVAAVESLPLGRKVRVRSDARGHFVGEFRLNGRRVEAMVDTGATLVALNLTTARRIGMQVGPADFRYTVETANGSVKAAGVTIDSLQIGRIAVRDVEAVVLEDRALAGTLIGVSFLKHLSRYAVADGALVLEQ